MAPLREMAKWVRKRRNEPHVVDKDWIVMGDFNIPKVGDETFKAITSGGLRLPEALLGAHGSNLDKKKRYDQILHDCTNPNRFTNHGGVLDYYAGNHAALFPGRTLSKREFTYQLSDHLPLWVQIRVDIEGEKLEQLLGPGQKRRRRRAR